ncbi:MAG: class I SAM-dependent methyltransferase [Bacteroidales bacterium]|nr:MAG: class I SAM-dependent methyltransferase [Bacteroidales bacterium]
MKNRQNKERKFWDRFANSYDSFIKNTVDKTYKSILENIDSELNVNQNILEIGTGTGIIPFSVCSKVSSITAIDISPEMIRIANQKRKDSNIKNIDFQVQDSYSLTFPDKSFDIAIASNLLHLLYEPEKPLNEVKRVMKDDGVFIAPTFCVGENMKSRVITSLAGVFSGFSIVSKWSINDYKSMLVSNGFTIDKAIRIDGRFPLAYIVMSKN